MKKPNKPGQKPKEFASRPFGPLKGVLMTEYKAEPRKAATPLPEPEIAPDDAALFLRAMADAKRLHPGPSSGNAGKPALLKPSRFDDEDRSLFLQALENLRLDVTFRDELPEEDEPARPLPINRLRQLKRGTIRLDFQLDLHGLTRDEGVKSLADFIGGAYQRGQKAVLVITGKGNRSPGEPVLQGAVTGWLREKGKAMVAEFAPAPRDLGGSGALVVFLKEKAEGP
jgi:DNA-nicking Smr family endonuclease